MTPGLYVYLIKYSIRMRGADIWHTHEMHVVSGNNVQDAIDFIAGLAGQEVSIETVHSILEGVVEEVVVHSAFQGESVDLVDLHAVSMASSHVEARPAEG